MFEEYKMFRETAINFDKILIDIRKSTITMAFIIFGLAVEAFRITNVPFGLSVIDLAIAIVLIEILVVMAFFYLEFHYRFYLAQIATIAAKYEKKLGLGIELEDCDLDCDENKAGISKCLACIHDKKMAFFTRIAHFNIYASLLSLGIIAFNTLMGFKIHLSIEGIIGYMIITGIITFGCMCVYGLRNIRKQNKPDNLKDSFNVYLFSIISFEALTYIFYFLIIKNEFVLSIIEAFGISVIIFFIFGFNSAVIEKKLKKFLFDIGIAPEKF